MAQIPLLPSTPFRHFLKIGILIGGGCLLGVFCLALVEAGLRVAGYGYQPALFLHESYGGRDMCVGNPRAAWRFFPGVMARRPLPEYFPVQRDEKRIRIFVLGESAARGEALADFSFSRMLEEMIQARFPGHTVEVINTGIPAINSWVMVDFVKDILTCTPDLLIIFAGNNEVIGPYGPGTVFTKLNQRRLIQFSIWLSGLRLGQLMKNLAEWSGIAHPGFPENAWKGLEMFLGNRLRSDDPRLRTCAENFRLNYECMLELAEGAGVKVIPCLVPANLRDFPPFASLHDPGLGPDQLQKWQESFRQGIELQKLKKWGPAVEAFRTCETLDPTYAELLFRQGQCFRALGDTALAERYFSRARDFDVLHFRATGEFNDAIVQACKRCPGAVPVPPLDFPALFAAVSPYKSPGLELLNDHVHLTLEGHYLVARTLFSTIMRSDLLPGLKQAGLEQKEPLSMDQIQRRLGYSLHDQKLYLERTLANVSRPPFTLQIDHEEYLNFFRRGIASVTAEEDLRPMGNEIEVYQEGLRVNPENRELTIRLGLAYGNHDMPQEAIAAFNRAAEMNPFDVDLYNNRGTIYLRLSRFQEAIRDFNQALELTPALAHPHSNLGILYSRMGKLDEAQAHFRAAVKIDAEFVPARINLGNLLFQEGDLTGANEQYLAALTVASGVEEAFLGLGNIHHKQGKADEAIENYLQAIQANASMSHAYFSLAGIYAEKKQEKAACENLWKAVQLAPDNSRYLKTLALLLATSENPEVASPSVAVELAERACHLTMDAEPGELQSLGVAYAAVGRLEDADKILSKGLALARQQKQGDLEKEFADLLHQLRSGRQQNRGSEGGL